MLKKIYLISVLVMFSSILVAEESATSSKLVIIKDNLSQSKVSVPIKITKEQRLGVSDRLVKASAPKEYIVKKTDTVAGVALKYLNKISYWPELLGVKSLGATRLYPGDQLNLISMGERKLLKITPKVKRKNYEKLIPEVHELSMEELPPIATKRLRNLFQHPTVIDEKIFESLPQVVGGNNSGQLYFTSGDVIYVKNYVGQVGDKVTVFSKLRKLIDPDTKQELGNEVRYNGEGVVTQVGATGQLTAVELDAVINQISPLDRVTQLPDQLIPEIVPHKADKAISGKIIGLYDSFVSVAENSTVVLNRGSLDGVSIGQVFDITDTQKIIDPSADPDHASYFWTPPRAIGEILIYKTYDKVSFGLITDSIQPIKLYAIVEAQQ